MSPAAQMSHNDNPPLWMNASNRPFATYARANAALPMERDTRMLRRIARSWRVQPPRVSDSETTQSDSFSFTGGRMGVPSSRAPLPACAVNISSRTGS
jgi:hypothetical protein